MLAASKPLSFLLLATLLLSTNLLAQEAPVTDSIPETPVDSLLEVTPVAADTIEPVLPDSLITAAVVDSTQLVANEVIDSLPVTSDSLRILALEARIDALVAAANAPLDGPAHLPDFVHQLLTAPSKDQAFTIELYNNAFDVYIVDTRKRNVGFYLYDKRQRNWSSLGRLKEGVEADKDQSLLFATNAGMYTPQHKPQGLYIENSVEYQPLDLAEKGYGNFYLQPNGVFYITETGKAGVTTTFEFDTITAPIKYATQSGPMLVINGERHDIFTKGSHNLNIRSGVGVLDDYYLVFVISQRPVNFYDFASLYRDYFGCEQALYLDGAISQSFIPQIGRRNLGGRFGPLIGVSRKLD